MLAADHYHPGGPTTVLRGPNTVSWPCKILNASPVFLLDLLQVRGQNYIKRQDRRTIVLQKPK